MLVLLKIWKLFQCWCHNICRIRNISLNKNIFDKVGVNRCIVESKIAIRTIQNGKIVDRVQNFEEFLYELILFINIIQTIEFFGKL